MSLSSMRSALCYVYVCYYKYIGMTSMLLAWLRALADDAISPVPTLHSSSTGRLKAPGASAYPATAVVTTKPALRQHHHDDAVVVLSVITIL